MELYFQTGDEWRSWLLKNYSSSDGVWLIYYKKGSGRKRIPYDDALDEALCFGWIDGKIRRINEEYYEQWFTPRRKGSRWSELNIGRVKRLISLGKMDASGMKAYNEVVEKPELSYKMDYAGIPDMPSDLFKRLKLNRKAMKNFNGFSPSAKKMYLRWLESAKKPETREKRIMRIIQQSEKNIRPGML
ncbi:MAG TPA: YdeI/OmpD-associated family protein [Bacteroidales bacterium]|nr:YdeI/OmpD-associated family protein [Bacteroidales bacterium]